MVPRNNPELVEYKFEVHAKELGELKDAISLLTATINTLSWKIVEKEQFKKLEYWFLYLTIVVAFTASAVIVLLLGASPEEVKWILKIFT